MDIFSQSRRVHRMVQEAHRAAAGSQRLPRRQVIKFLMICGVAVLAATLANFLPSWESSLLLFIAAILLLSWLRPRRHRLVLVRWLDRGLVVLIAVGLLFFPVWAILLLILLPTIALFRRFRARHRAAAIMRWIDHGMMQNRPLPEWLAMAGSGQRGALARRLLVLAELLREGMSLPMALEFGLPELNSADVAAMAQADDAPAARGLPGVVRRLACRAPVVSGTKMTPS